MAESEATPDAGAVAAPEQQTDETKIAGKYADQATFETSLVEARKTLGLADLPADLPIIGENGVFRTLEAAEANYADLDKLINSRQPAKPAATAPADLAITKPEETGEETIEQVLAATGLDGEQLAQQFQEHGKLTADQYAALKKRGYSAALVDMTMRGLQAEAQAVMDRSTAAVTQAQQIAGGETQEQTLREWAAYNMPPDWLADWNQQVEQNPGRYPDMMALIKQKHTEAVGATNTRPLVGGSVPAGGASGFTSSLELQTAVKEAKTKHGDAWSQDPDLQARLKATPAHIRRGAPAR